MLINLPKCRLPIPQFNRSHLPLSFLFVYITLIDYFDNKICYCSPFYRYLLAASEDVVDYNEIYYR